MSPAVAESGEEAGAPEGAVDDGQQRARPLALINLARQTLGAKRLETELLRLFMRQSEQIQASLDREGPERRDGQPACDLLHMLLGSARVVGATAVAALAQRIEAERRQSGGDPDDLPEADRARLRDVVARTNRFIAGLLGPT